MSKILMAEFIGTFWLVFGGTGAAVIAAAFPDVGIGLLGVALAFGLTVFTMAHAVGRISGAHLNPAVTIGLASGGIFPWKSVVPYVIAQVLGAIAASGLLYAIVSGNPEWSLAGSGLAANGYGEHSPGGYSMTAALIIETLLTFVFVFIIYKSVEPVPSTGFAPLTIGMTLTLIHLISIPVTNTSVNPARSTGPAVFMGDWALSQLWFFWAFPILGAILGGLFARAMRDPETR